MELSSWGDIVFEVSQQRIRTIDEFERSGSARWAIQEPLGSKPLPQFIGDGQDTIRFALRLYAMLGIDPAEEMKRLWDKKSKGVVARLMWFGYPFGSKAAKWYIQTIEEEIRHISREKFLGIEATITMGEYH